MDLKIFSAMAHLPSFSHALMAALQLITSADTCQVLYFNG
jgi:hypothetical protein